MSSLNQAHHEADVLWGEVGIDAAIGLVSPLYEPPTSSRDEA